MLVSFIWVEFLTPLYADPMASASYRITRTVISNGGAAMGSTSFNLNATICQSSPPSDPTSPPLSTNYELFSGFWFILFFQADSDNDGLPDILEESGCTKPFDADTDDDGLLDGDEDVNHDGSISAGETDPCLNDTDDDGIQDGTESGVTLRDIGPDTDTEFFIPDEDPSTTTDPLDYDTDNDGMSDGEEDADHNGAVNDGETDPNVFDPSTAAPWIPFLLLED